MVDIESAQMVGWSRVRKRRKGLGEKEGAPPGGSAERVSERAEKMARRVLTDTEDYERDLNSENLLDGFDIEGVPVEHNEMLLNLRRADSASGEEVQQLLRGSNDCG